MTDAGPIKGLGTLTPLQREIVDLFADLPDKGQFYFTGGAALAEYYLGHRRSFDLDFFTGTEDIVIPISYQIESLCQKRGLPVKVIRRLSTFVQFVAEKEGESLKVDMALDSPFRFEPSVFTQEGIFVNNYADLRIDKVLAYFGRAEPRDAIDLYFILQKESPEILLEQAAQKDPGFDLYWFAIALNRAEKFPDELERWPVKMLQPFDPRRLKQTLLDWAIELMNKITSK
ncbi:MAG: nucleotidyl transferase AbiEii/AbiGii toxin family protein [Chloroflexota bacterium]